MLTNCYLHTKSSLHYKTHHLSPWNWKNCSQSNLNNFLLLLLSDHKQAQDRELGIILCLLCERRSSITGGSSILHNIFWRHCMHPRPKHNMYYTTYYLLHMLQFVLASTLNKTWKKLDVKFVKSQHFCERLLSLVLDQSWLDNCLGRISTKETEITWGGKI